MKKKIQKVVQWYKRPKSKIADFFETLLIVVPIAFLIRTVGYGLYQVPSGSMETTMLVGERFLSDKLTIWFKPPQRGDIIAFNDPTYPYSDNKVKNWWERYVWGPANWTKRVIGIPGDHVQGKIEDGKPVLYLNGSKLEEPYVNKFPLVYERHVIPTRQKANFQDVDLGLVQEECTHLSLKSYDPEKPFSEQPFYTLNQQYLLRDSAGNIIQELPATPKSHDVFDVHLGDNEYWAMGDNRLGSSDSRYWNILDGKLIHGKIIFRIWSMDTNESWMILDLIKHPIDFWKKVRWNRCFQKVS